MVQFETLDTFLDYGRCLKITNGLIEAVATLDVGPRIVSFSFVGGKNVLMSDRKAFTPQGGEAFDRYYYQGAQFENLGGHRIWISPESLPETYYPDAKPVEYKVDGDKVTFFQKEQTENGVKIRLTLKMSADQPEMIVENTAENISNSNKEFAVWAITVMNREGLEIIPQNTNDTGLLSNRKLILWPYTKIGDERLTLGDRYITLRQDPENDHALKIGTDCNSGTGYYVLGDTVFRKKYQHKIGGNYPDGGVSYETYTNNLILEFETLSELYEVKPNEAITHSECWQLYKAQKPLSDNADEQKIAAFLSAL